MLRSNSKAAKQGIYNYMLECAESINDCAGGLGYIFNDGTYYNAESLEDVARAINESFIDEYVTHNKQYEAGRISRADLFIEWASGLPCGCMFDYWNDCTAVRILGDILDESEEERARFTEADAEKMLTRLIYREVEAINGRRAAR